MKNKRLLFAIIFIAFQMILLLGFGRVIDSKLKKASMHSFIISSLQPGEDIKGKYLLISIDGEDAYYDEDREENAIYGIMEQNGDREYFVNKFVKEDSPELKEEIYLRVERRNNYGAKFNLKYYGDEEELEKIYDKIEINKNYNMFNDENEITGAKGIAIIKVKDGYGKVENITIKEN
ncbi:MAG: hypothetical protein N4A47_06025 [Clostridia bacterium]|jgi:hypothetical protein|nr:hypothetical protein [Clostridia bacterium]